MKILTDYYKYTKDRAIFVRTPIIVMILTAMTTLTTITYNVSAIPTIAPVFANVGNIRTTVTIMKSQPLMHMLDEQTLASQMPDAHMLDAQMLDAQMIDAHIRDAQMLDAHMIDAHVFDARMRDAKVLRCIWTWCNQYEFWLFTFGFSNSILQKYYAPHDIYCTSYIWPPS